MGILRIYRKFYCVDTSTSPYTYTLINPTSLSAATYVAGTGGTESSTLIESEHSITQEKTGIYYADLTPRLYASDVTYDLVWYVQYTPEAPAGKKLTTRFRIKPYNVATGLDFEVSSNLAIECEISNNLVIEYEVLGTYN